jgi:hypothetical protein
MHARDSTRAVVHREQQSIMAKYTDASGRPFYGQDTGEVGSRIRTFKALTKSGITVF